MTDFSHLKEMDGITVFGPTASGKTKLALDIAKAVDGEIINADSRQIYAYMPILTACPSNEEYEQVPHHLFEVLDPREKLTAYEYAGHVKDVVADVKSRGKKPILCGGTGFYIKVCLEGISPVPSVPDDIVQYFSQQPNEALHPYLMQIDPETAENTPLEDTQRLIRALSVFKHTGKPLSEFQKMPRQGGLGGTWHKIALQPDREWLMERIEARYDQMVEAGVEAELRKMFDAGYSRSDHGIDALGCREFFSYFNMETSLEEVRESIIKQTKAYAKRQITWARTQYKPDEIIPVG